MSAAGIVTVVAGNGTGDYGGDGGPATAAELNTPQGLTFDAAGNLYIADINNNAIRKVNTAGIISTVAGEGYYGYSGDGGAATNARLYAPRDVKFDAAGNFYIVDYSNNVIRKVNTAGIISTVAGNDTAGYRGDGGVATTAELNEPYAVALDPSGNLYIADYGNSRIRMVNTSGMISTVAGDNTAGYTGDGGAATAAELHSARGIALDASGNFYISDERNQVIRKVNTLGIISTFAGNGVYGYSGDGGAATLAQLNNPYALTVDASGNLYIADAGNVRVRKVNTTGIISSVAGDGTSAYGDGNAAVAAELYQPHSTVFDASGNMYIADADNNRVRKVSPSGIITTYAGSGNQGFSGDGGPATIASLYHPTCVAFDASGNLYIADEDNNRIRKVTTSGTITTVAGSSAYGFGGDGGAAVAAKLNYPYGVAPDASGNLYIADQYNHRIRMVNTAGIISTVAGNGTQGYLGDNGPATAAELNYPTCVVLDASGDIYIADQANNLIREVNSAGTITTVAGDFTLGAGYSGDGGPATAAELYNPLGITLDDSGNLFIADYVNSVVREVNTSGIINTVAGNSLIGYSGDGAAATLAKLNGPTGVTVDASGNIFIADRYNNRIREVTNGFPLVINQLTNKQDLTIYPIPTNGQFTVQIDNGGSPITNTTLSIYDMLGKQVYTQAINTPQNNLNVNLNDGIYILRVVSDKGVVSKRVEVMR